MAYREESTLLFNDCLLILRHAPDCYFRGYLPSIPDKSPGGENGCVIDIGTRLADFS